MIKVDKIEVFNFEGAIRGMRNPMNSWKKSDSYFGCSADRCDYCLEDCTSRNHVYVIGDNDMALMRRLYKGGSEHRKYLRQIFVTMDITAPLYWWKEFDTYKVGTVANSCSTMHKIHDKEFTLGDFSHEHMSEGAKAVLKSIIERLNTARDFYNNKIDKPSMELHWKTYWWDMIQLLPTSYNQKRTVTFNYENVINMIHQRENHKLDEWREFVKILRKLPYVEAIRGEK